MWKRGKRSRSNSCTFTPCCASKVETVDPAGPPPITTTSGFAIAMFSLGFHDETARLHFKPGKRTTRHDADGDRQAKRLAELQRHAPGDRRTVSGVRTEFDLEPERSHRVFGRHNRTELHDLSEAPHDGLDPDGIHVHALDVDHVVGATEDAAFEPGPRATAWAWRQPPYDDVAGAIADDGARRSSQIGDDELAVFAV